MAVKKSKDKKLSKPVVFMGALNKLAVSNNGARIEFLLDSKGGVVSDEILSLYQFKRPNVAFVVSIIPVESTPIPVIVKEKKKVPTRRKLSYRQYSKNLKEEK